MKKYIKFIPYVIIGCILFLSVGYATFTSKMTIAGITASVRPEKDIRVTSFYATSNENNGQSYWEEYSVSRISSDIAMPQEDSTISYKVQITNLGGISMSVTDITGLPDNMEIVYTDYELGETLCDPTKTEEPCKLGAQDEFTITIKYKDGEFNSEITEYQLRLDLVFECVYTVNYISNKLSLPVKYDLSYNDSINDSITENEGVYTIVKNGKYTGLYLDGSNFKDATTYILRYKLKKISGTLQNIGGHSEYSIQKSFTIDGIPSSATYAQPKTNLPDDTNEHIIEYKFEYDEDYVTSSSTINKNIYIQVNRMGSDAPSVTVDIYDIEVYEVYDYKTYYYNIKDTIISGPLKDGYAFIGWNTESDGSGTTYVEGQEVVNLSTSNGDEINLYAQWKIKEYDIIFRKNGLPVGYQEVEYIESTGTQIINTGYIPKKNTKLELELSFNGTFQDSETTGKGNSILSGGYTDDNDTFQINFGGVANQSKTLFPWFNKTYASGATAEPIVVTNAILNNKNTITVEPGKISYGTVSRTITKKTGDQTSELYLFGNYTNPFGNYNMRVYKLTLSEDGNIKGIYIPCYRISDNEIGLYDIVNDEFHTNIGTGTFNKGADTGDDGNVSIDGTMVNQHFVYGTAQNLTKNTYTKEGYTFVGWNTQPDGSGTSYTDEQEVNNLTSIDGDEINLYAQWEEISTSE